MEELLLPRLAPVDFFPWELFGYMLGFGAVAILFIFYFNRALAYILTIVVRSYLWHYYRSSISIEGIQVSPLAGRVFVKNLKYYGRNEIISISGCYITWKYWLRHVLHSEISDEIPLSNADSENDAKRIPLCKRTQSQFMERLAGNIYPRVILDIRGLEWFVFNRSPAYDGVLAAVSNSSRPSPADDSNPQDQSAKVKAPATDPTNQEPSSSNSEKKEWSSTSSPPMTPVQLADTSDSAPLQQQLPSFLRLFPIGVVCKKAAMVMGNEGTMSILVATAAAAEGLIDARAARMEDIYKQCFDFSLENLAVKFKQNEDYLENILVTGADQGSKAPKNPSEAIGKAARHPASTVLHKLRSLFPNSIGSVESLAQNPGNNLASQNQHIQEGRGKWLGLSRYLEADEDELFEHERWKGIEYAQVSAIADCPSITVSFFWDVPGKVRAPLRTSKNDTDNETPLLHINGGPAPEWGFDVNINGGTINYGPWADRQRANLQNVFFPSAYTSSVPATPLVLGQQRQSTQFKINITLDDAVNVRLHTREESKDWKWKGSLQKTTVSDKNQRKKTNRKKHSKDSSETEIRPPGWLYLTAATNTSVTYTMDMLASATAFGNKLEVDIPSIQLTTSVNHGLFMKSQSMILSCDLSNPLGWNKLRTWFFNITCQQAEMFFLRDHAFLLTDVINDWTSGPPSEFMTFVPFLYKFDLNLEALKIHLNVNDANIIDVPASPPDNAYMLLGAKKLSTTLDVPSINYRPLRNAINFDAVLSGINLDLLSPRWNTLHCLLKQNRLGQVKQLTMHGCYDYCTSNSPAQTDILTLDLIGESLVLHVYGFLIRHFLTFRENYFGDDMHFQTLEEYQQKLSVTGIDGGTRSDHASAKITNDLDVILSIKTKDSSLILPSGIYSAENHIRVDIPLIGLDLRFTNYYMDLDISASPLSLARGTMSTDEVISKSYESSTQIYLDGLWLSGHRLFGLPPTEPTYVCNWDFVIGSLTGECSIDFLNTLAAAGRAIAFQAKDIENALPRKIPKTIHDVTFLRAKIAPINIWLRVNESALQFRSGSSSFQFNDLAGKQFSERLQADFPDISLSIIDTASVSRRDSKLSNEVLTHALMKTSISIGTLETAAKFNASRQLQQDHIRKHDSRTQRTPWLLATMESSMGMSGQDFQLRPRPAAMPVPPIPDPVGLCDSEQQSIKAISENSNGTPGVNRRRSSFLSVDSNGRPPRMSPSRSLSRAYNGGPATVTLKQGEQAFTRSASRGQIRASKLAFSSSYAIPHFPLQVVQPDTKDLPHVRSRPPRQTTVIVSEEGIIDTPEDDIVRSTITISCGSGIAAFLTPKALMCIKDLMQALQPTNPSQVLDDIQISALPQVPLAFNRPKSLKTIQIRFELPQVAIRLISESTIPNAPFEWQTYEIGLSELMIVARLGSETPDQLRTSSSTTTVHASLECFQVAVRGQQSDSTDDEARVQLNIAASTAWLHSDSKATGQIQSDRIEIISLNRRVEYLAAIVSNAVTSIDELVVPFQELGRIAEAQQQHVVHFLSSARTELADPTFLNNASYIARATTEHARNSDTWKMITRLRYVHNNLLKLNCMELSSIFDQAKSPLNSNQVEEVIHAFTQWRGWDLEDLATSAFMKQVFNKLNDTISPETVRISIALGLNLSSFTAVIDPGPSQNQIQLQHIALTAESAVDQPVSENHVPMRTTSTTLFISETIVHLNWEILEFVEGVLRHLAANGEPAEKIAATEVQAIKTNATCMHHVFHLVTSLETIDIGFKTIHLELTTLTRFLQTSTLLKRANGKFTDVNALVNAEFNATKLSSHGQFVLVTQLLDPSIHGSLSIKANQIQTIREWTGGAICQKLELDLRQNVIELLGIADLLLKDEFVYLQSLASILQTDSPPAAKDAEPIVTNRTRDVVHAALLLEDYRLSFAILSSLHYVLSGHVARSRIASTAASRIVLDVGFDVKQHVHTVENRADNAINEVASLALPPINGRINLEKQDSTLRTNLSLSLDKIELDASAIHALFNTFSRREVASFRKNVMREVRILQSDQRILFKDSTSSEGAVQQPATLKVSYKVDLVAEGVSVTAITAKSSKQPARLLFDMGPVFVDLKNESQGIILAFPQANAEVKDIKVLLERSTSYGFHSCGDVLLGFSVSIGSTENDNGRLVRCIEVSATGPEVNIYAETAPTIVDIVGYLQQRFKDFNLSEELHTLRARRNRSKSIVQEQVLLTGLDKEEEEEDSTAVLFSSMFSVELSGVQIAWRVGDLRPISPTHDVEDLIFSIDHITLATRHANSAKLVMQNLQLQMVPGSQSSKVRSRNSALMPEVLFNVAYVSTSKDRRFAFQAVGKSVDLRLTPRFVLPAADLQRSIALATEDLRKVVADWNSSFLQDEQNKKLIAAKRISSVLVDADFAGAVVNLQATGNVMSPTSPYSSIHIDHRSNHLDNVGDLGRTSAVFRTPGIAFKVEYSDLEVEARALNAEIRIDASSNTLQPSIVPLILELSNSIREIVHEKDDGPSNAIRQTSATPVDNEPISDPVAILGDCKLNLGLRICRQKFGLSCQPIAKVEARAEFDDIYVTINTVQVNEQDRFFTLSARIKDLEASVQHTYSQEATGRFAAESIELSLMNSRHVSDIRGISAILSLAPVRILLNVRQLHDFLLFREIWLPEALQQSQAQSMSPEIKDERQSFMMQRYQQVATASPFPWNATIAIAEVDVELDLGQSLGKSTFNITKFWTASRKLSNWEQNLHIGFESIKLDCTGRLNCYVGLRNMSMRTSIKWPTTNELSQQIPLIQASVGFDDFQVKAAFEYQAFLVGNFSSLKFLMYNVRDGTKGRDRLVCTVDGDKVQTFFTTQSSASVLALHQAVQRLILEKKQSFENSLRDIQRYYRRAYMDVPNLGKPQRMPTDVSLSGDEIDKTPLQLQTNVVITLKLLNVGAYPRSFADNTIFKLDALDAQARFSVILKDNTVQSSLGLSLGQVRVALSNINRGLDVPNFEEMTIEDVINHSTGSRGGTILKVPRVHAGMQTWQVFGSKMVEYIFRSSFEGKVEVGWNINRINVIRTMWTLHSKALASRLGKALPLSAVQITGVPTAGSEGKEKQDKITAVVNVPLSKYSYTAREPPVIETPQLRDMGEATPPLEWIGLQRDRLPNLTHQIIIVPLLEVAKEVEDAYGKILGVS